MQDPTVFPQIKPQFPTQEHLKCPRCDSNNTKFCYYNNYNLSQPRHFCKNCKRYWTKGGTLRNIPVGGGSRKNTKRSSTQKRSSTTPSSSTSNSSKQNTLPKEESYGLPVPTFDQDRGILDINGSFSSLLASNGLIESLNPNGSSMDLVGFAENSGSGPGSNGIRNDNPSVELQNSNDSESFLVLENGGDSSFWNGGGNGWPDLAIYRQGSSFP